MGLGDPTGRLLGRGTPYMLRCKSRVRVGLRIPGRRKIRKIRKIIKKTKISTFSKFILLAISDVPPQSLLVGADALKKPPQSRAGRGRTSGIDRRPSLKKVEILDFSMIFMIFRPTQAPQTGHLNMHGVRPSGRPVGSPRPTDGCLFQ